MVWDDIQPAGSYTCFCGKGKYDHHVWTGFMVCVKISYIIMRVKLVTGYMECHWCSTYALNMCAMTDGSKNSFYDELGGVFDNFLMYDMKMLSTDFNAEVGKEDILELKIWIESLY